MSLLLLADGGVGVERVGAESLDDQQTDVIVGEIIVKFERRISIEQGISKLQEVFKEQRLEKLSEISVINAVVLRTHIYDLYQKGKIDREEAQQKTINLIQQIQAHPFVESAQPNEEIIERFPPSLGEV
jgi:hypothetical protein